MRTHFPPCPGLRHSLDTSRYTPGSGEGGVGAGEPHHGGFADTSGLRPSARPAALATEPISGVSRRAVLHGARLLATASPRGPGLRVGGCHWSGGTGAACPVRVRGGDGAGRCNPHPGKNAGMAAEGKDMESWHSPTLAKGRQSSDDSQEHLPVKCRWRRTKLQIKIPFKRCPGQ